MSVTFKLEDFEGPLDLLLYLLEKNKMSIYDIEISSITDQYLAYIETSNTVELPQPSTEDVLMDVTLEQLYETFQALLKQKQLLVHQKSKKIDSSILKKDSFTIEQKSLYILNLLELNAHISFFSLCTPDMPKVECIVTFMSILELIHKKQIRVVQEKPLADIMIMGVKAYAKD